MAEQLCDLLGMSVDSFLQLTEVHTLPYLVYTRRREIIMRIAAAYPSKSAFELCMERNNFASIIAYLLSQPEENHEAMIYSLLVDIDPKFKETSVTMLLKAEPIPITRELLKNMGDAGDGHDGKVRLCSHLSLWDFSLKLSSLTVHCVSLLSLYPQSTPRQLQIRNLTERLDSL